MIKFIQLVVLIPTLFGATHFVANLEDISVKNDSFAFINFIEIQHVILEEDKQPRTFPDTQNLQDYIRPFHELNCHIVINNFQGVNLFPKMEYPLLLKHPFPVAVTFIDENLNKSTLEITWGLISSRRNIFNCSSSKFLSPFPDYSWNPQYCSQIILSEYFKNTKPWNCVVRFDVFPPLYLFHLGYADIFKFYLNWGSFLGYPPSLPPSSTATSEFSGSQ